jgi:plasmid stability protein
MVAVTIRNVPDDVRNALAARAASAGQSMQEFVLDLLTDTVSRPSQAEVLARIRRHAREYSPVGLDDILSDLAADRR